MCSENARWIYIFIYRMYVYEQNKVTGERVISNLGQY
jgi:hypothetical protein